MKTMSVFLFGFKFSVQLSVHYRYEVQLHSGDWPVEGIETHPCKTYIGAVYQAHKLARNRKDGWLEKCAVVIFDKHIDDVIAGIQVMPSVKYKVKYSRFR